jgi:antitoxin MazE
MHSRVQKWGNSLALRIPRPFADEVGLGENSPVELSLRGRSLVVRPADKVSLRALLSKVTDANRHHELDTGTPVRRETW